MENERRMVLTWKKAFFAGIFSALNYGEFQIPQDEVAALKPKL